MKETYLETALFLRSSASRVSSEACCVRYLAEVRAGRTRDTSEFAIRLVVIRVSGLVFDTSWGVRLGVVVSASRNFGGRHRSWSGGAASYVGTRFKGRAGKEKVWWPLQFTLHISFSMWPVRRPRNKVEDLAR